MSKPGRDLIISLIRPPLIVIGFVTKSLYSLFFGWADKRLGRRLEQQLGKDIKQNLSFIFDQYGGVIVPNTGVRFPLPFDYAVVTIEAADLLFRFYRGRGDLNVYVAPKQAPNDWNDVSLVISALKAPDDMQRRTFVLLSDMTYFLKAHMSEIQAAFSPENYANTLQNLAAFKRYERVVAKQLETEINRRLYS
jgi:hypothetical protein